MQLLKLLLKILNCKAGNEAPLSLWQLFVVQTWKARLRLICMLCLDGTSGSCHPSLPPLHSHPVRAQGLAL